MNSNTPLLEVVSAARVRLLEHCQAAVDTLVVLMQSESEETARKAAVDVLRLFDDFSEVECGLEAARAEADSAELSAALTDEEHEAVLTILAAARMRQGGGGEQDMARRVEEGACFVRCLRVLLLDALDDTKAAVLAADELPYHRERWDVQTPVCWQPVRFGLEELARFREALDYREGEPPADFREEVQRLRRAYRRVVAEHPGVRLPGGVIEEVQA